MTDGAGRGDAGAGEAVLLMETWSDGEAEMVRQILESNEIPCRVVSDVTHAVFPLSVDGLGEIRLLVPRDRIDEALEILAQHRREGLEIVPGGLDEDPEPPGGGTP